MVIRYNKSEDSSSRHYISDNVKHPICSMPTIKPLTTKMIVKMDILNVNAGIYFDDVVTSAEKHTHQAYASTSLNNNDEIRIPIQ
ncbi:hypothetical protein NQ315_011068 [Exocentrus adspersus]|uniref:Uncharacterized protein n=1 Tax=Exocentrus adspersus TaxID=1586481 RepID=A0AAV8V8J0_9CUCU|nr:hypothetical protein NQ315_011068 [Exocentrus adspersus]